MHPIEKIWDFQRINFTRLTIEEREKIHLQINEGKSNRYIANSLGRSHTAICQEVHRFPIRFEYSRGKAHQQHLDLSLEIFILIMRRNPRIGYSLHCWQGALKEHKGFKDAGSYRR